MTKSIQENIVLALKAKDIETALTHLYPYLQNHLSSAMPQVYLGMIAELQDQPSLAMRHYRAALALDGTCRLAIKNLYRCGDSKKSSILFECED